MLKWRTPLGVVRELAANGSYATIDAHGGTFAGRPSAPRTSTDVQVALSDL
jgi:hypothetical protein